MRTLITGGAGFIGSALVDSLVQSGDRVCVVDDGSTGDLHRLDPSVELHKIDIASVGESEWRDLLRPSDTVFHLAARKLNTPGVTDADLVQTNLASTIALSRAAANVGIKKLVFSSSLYVYGHSYTDPTEETFMPLPQTLYGMSKLAGEHAIASILGSSAVEWNCVRLYFVYGPRQYPGSGYKSVIVKNFERIREGLAPIIRGSGEQSLDYVYISDVIEALRAVSSKAPSGARYNVSSGRAVSIRKLTDLMLEISDRTDLHPTFVDADWTEGTRRLGYHHSLSNELGWTPRVTLRGGLERTWHYIYSEKIL